MTERGTSLRIEILAGVTTFAATAYIIVVNPAILQFAGLPTGPSTVATILAAAFGFIFVALAAVLGGGDHATFRVGNHAAYRNLAGGIGQRGLLDRKIH